uniref:Uncharacterized protein n=1 Tax=Rhizophora mucronata TaxID=61149 RepID=A0A2P2Q271_RHIMU
MIRYVPERSTPGLPSAGEDTEVGLLFLHLGWL